MFLSCVRGYDGVDKAYGDNFREGPPGSWSGSPLGDGNRAYWTVHRSTRGAVGSYRRGSVCVIHTMIYERKE